MSSYLSREETRARDLELLRNAVRDGEDIKISRNGNRVGRIEELEGLAIQELMTGGCLAVSINGVPLLVERSGLGISYIVKAKICTVTAPPTIGEPDPDLLELLGSAYGTSRCSDL